MLRSRKSQPVNAKGAIAVALGAALVVTALVTPAHADDEDRLNAGVGYPEWSGAEQPVPDLPADFTPGNQLQAIMDADLAAGAGQDIENDFWVDDMLARYADAGGYGDTNNWLFSRGRAAYMYTHDPDTLGFAGSAAYWDELGTDSFYELTAAVDGDEVDLTEDVESRKQTPSYFTTVFTGAGLQVRQTKFITEQNVVITNVELTSTDGAAHEVTLTGTSPLAAAAEGEELTGVQGTKNDITTLYPRFSGDGFAPQDGALVAELSVPADGAVSTKVQLGLLTDEIPASATEYEFYRDAEPADAYTEHVTAYNQWWADNVPYLDTPEDNIDKTLFYRWWLLRFNFLDANVPGNDFQFPVAIEGVLGYNNSIVLTAGMFIDDLKYLRDPAYSYGTWVSAGETSRSGRMVDNPGEPANWSNSYTEYIPEAAWRSYEMHGGPTAIAERLGTYGENDVTGLLEDFDSNGNNLIEYDWGAMTGNDADAVSFDWAREHGHAAMDRTESAYLYSNALAAAEAYEVAGRTADADRMTALAEDIKSSLMEVLWNPDRQLIEHRQSGGDELLVDWKEINNYYPFSVGLVPQPGDEDYDDDYVEALRLWQDYDEYPIFPFYTANQADAAERGDSGSNNFSVINSTVTFRMLASVLRDYPTDYLSAEDYKKLLYWNAWAHYIDGDNRLPDQNEFWHTASANTDWGDTQEIGYRSWIHHTMLGLTNFTMIEDAMGLRPRSDAMIELDPIDIDWPYFTANNIRYRNVDLSIVWDEPGDGERPYGESVPEGHSVFVDGELAFTADSLSRVVYDPDAGEIVESDEGVTITEVHPHEVLAPEDVRFDDDARVVDLMAKAGTDVATGTTGSPNLAEGAQVSASFTAEEDYSSPEAAVDGTTINEPFWGTAGSPEAADTLEVDLGESTTFDDLRVYFYRTSSSDADQGGRTAGTRQGYAAPQEYTLEYYDGSSWQEIPDQARTPAYPTGNFNHVQFPPVTGSKVRITATHLGELRTGIKELQVFDTGVAAPSAENVPPQVRARVADGSGGVRQLIGTVRDDARPGGQLSYGWSVVEAPEEATVTVADPSAASTSVRFTEPGTYTLELAADDGEATSSAQVTFTVDDLGGGNENIAPSATPTAEFTAGWNDVNAVNDGEGVNSGGAQDAVWATWSGDEPATRWLQYTWEDPVRIHSSEMMFWSDTDPGLGEGVAVPESWSMQYLDPDSEEWTDMPNATEYGTAATGTNATEFDSVTTTAVRATFNAYPDEDGQYAAVGVSEWQIFADAPEEIVPIDVRTDVGALPELPETVTGVYPDGSRSELAVSWADVTEEQVAADGDFTVTGTVSGSSLPASAHVWVRATEPGQINTIDAVDLHTLVGKAPALPETISAQYNDGSREMLPVTWEEIDPEAYAEPGSFDVTGTVDGPGTNEALAHVLVLEADDGEEPDEGLAVSATATGRCVLDEAKIYVQVSNDEAGSAVDLTVASEHDEQAIEDLQPEETTSVVLDTGEADLAAGTVTISGSTADGESVSAEVDYDELACS